MKLVQASWSLTGEFYLWGENHELVSAGGEHGIALPIAELAEIAAAAGIEEIHHCSLSLSLPARRGIPVKRLAADESVALETVTVPALQFDPYSAVDLLSSLPDLGLVAARAEPSLLYWIEATKFLLELLTRGRILPSLRRAGNDFGAEWRPVHVEDRTRLNLFASSLPLCAGTVSDADPNLVVRSFLRHGTDALVRFFLCGMRFVPEDEDSTVSNQWLRALTSERPEVDGPAADLTQLEDRLRTWAGSMLESEEKPPLEVAFRFVAPGITEAVEQSVWRVEFLLKSPFESRHLLRATDLWEGDRGFLRDSPYEIEELEEILLEGLGRAATAVPALRAALRSPDPTDLVLTLLDAYHFLREDLPVLERLGFTVLLPPWWRGPRPQLGLHLEVSDREGHSGLGMSRLLDFSWQVSLGDRLLTHEEFADLVSRTTPLAVIGGEWVELSPERLRHTLAFLERERARPQRVLIDAIRFRLGFDEEEHLPVISFRSRGWVERFFDREAISLEPIAQPISFHGQLRHYQLEGLSWLILLSRLGIGGCLADDMGLGKTIQFLALLLHERENGTAALPTLLVVPLSILGNWQRECAKFAPSVRVYLHHGSSRLSGEDFLGRCNSSDLVITTYSLLYRDEASFGRVQWGRIALDEAQNIKNLSTKQTQAIRRLTVDQLESSRGTVHRLALTGTPLENHLEELWSILDFLNPSVLGSLREFRVRFAVPIERFRDPEAADRLVRVVRPFLLRRLKTDPRVIADLPQKIEMDEIIPLTPEQASSYQQVLDSMLPDVEQASGLHRKGMVLATITRLKQVCDHPSLAFRDGDIRPERSAKILRLQELLDTLLDEGDRVLIFTQFARMGELLQRILQDRYSSDVLFLHGGLTRAAREAVIARFDAPDGPRLFVLSLKAGGIGLNLTAANQVIHFDQWWNPAVEEQATDRVYRIGQKKNVQVRKLICRGTLEERIAELLREKRNLADQVIRSAGTVLTQMTFEELRQVLALTPDGRGEEE